MGEDDEVVERVTKDMTRPTIDLTGEDDEVIERVASPFSPIPFPSLELK